MHVFAGSNNNSSCEKFSINILPMPYQSGSPLEKRITSLSRDLIQLIKSKLLLLVKNFLSLVNFFDCQLFISFKNVFWCSYIFDSNK